MTVICILVLRRRDVRQSKMVGSLDAKLLTAFYITTILFGVFLVDIGDTDDSMVSVASNLLGQDFVTPSGILSMVTGGAAIILLVATVTVVAVEFVRSRKASSI